jgi:RimJ/RimL family protein N-acetyltransferase
VITGILRHGADSAAPPLSLQPNERRNALSADHADKRGLDALESATISEIRGKIRVLEYPLDRLNRILPVWIAMPRVQFDPPASCAISNFLTGSPYYVVRGDRLTVTSLRLEEITAICNEPEVYNWLFREPFDGKLYTPANASEFVEWYSTGWREGSYFVFFVTTGGGQVAAACDIKSNDSDGAEIGYWASAHHRGVMTNAVVQVCTLACQAGFRSLSARTKKPNERSARVLTRAGFALVPGVDGDSSYNRFRINLVG